MIEGSVTGLSLVLANLNKANKGLAAGLNRGLKTAGLKLQRESQRIVPVDYGNLKASAYTRATGEGFGTSVQVGYTAAYAIFVHENTEMRWKGLPRLAPHKGRYWDPQGRGQSKFLETPMRTLGPQLLQIIKTQMKLI